MNLLLERETVLATSLLFVYGTLRRGFDHPMARLLALHAVYKGAGRMNGRLYHLGRYPGAILSHHPCEWVKGDLYELKNPPSLLARLDRYEGVITGRSDSAEYRCAMATIVLEDGTPHLAWVYLYNLRAQRPKRLISGDFQRQRRRPPLRGATNGGLIGSLRLNRQPVSRSGKT